MLKKISVSVICFVLALPALVQAFDCLKPDYGASLEEVNKEGYFVKYKEKDGISYYNYTGPCRLPFHEHSNPAIFYAFIDNHLYAKIMTFQDSDISLEEKKANIIRRLAKTSGVSQYEVKEDGDWLIYQSYDENTNMRYKIKLNTITKLTKTAFYFERLREKLPKQKEANDPASLSD
jgi:hypothetical protein